MADTNGALSYALSTWTFLLFRAGKSVLHPQVAELCEAVSQAGDTQDGEAKGLAMVEAIGSLLADDSVESLLSAGAALFGDQAQNSMGAADRASNLQGIRAYQFSSGLPWLAQIWQRDANGAVAPAWILIEKVSDHVLAMDPNPFDDVDEQRAIPVADFQVLWELSGCASLRLG